MKRIGWMGWLLAGLLLLQNAAAGLAAPAGGDPLEGHLLQHTNGALYLYHGGLKFVVQVADLGDPVIEAIPAASSEQWDALLGAAPGPRPALPPTAPTPFPGYS
jgi:hypothetical protein